MSGLLLLSVLGPGLAMADGSLSMAVTQDDGVDVTVSDDNGTVAGASLTVSVDDENKSYAGTGEYVTDENGTVELPAPNETVNVTMVAEHANETVTESVTLEASNGSEASDGAFGQDVQAFVHGLLENGTEDNKSIGWHVATYVTTHNPGNAPDHAGPPEDPGNMSDAERGPPEHAGNGSDAERGPPEGAGNGSGGGPQGPPQNDD